MDKKYFLSKNVAKILSKGDDESRIGMIIELIRRGSKHKQIYPSGFFTQMIGLAKGTNYVQSALTLTYESTLSLQQDAMKEEWERFDFERFILYYIKFAKIQTHK